MESSVIKRLDIGFSNNIFDNPFDVVENVNHIATEFRTIEIEIAEGAEKALFESDASKRETIIKRLIDLRDALHLTYCVHAAWFGVNTDILSADPKIKLNSHRLLCESIEFAKAIGAPTVTFHPGNSGGRSGDQLMNAFVESVQEIASQCVQDNMNLCVEIMGAQRPKYAVFYPKELMEICERAHIWLCMDLPHLASLIPDKKDLLRAVQTLAPYSRQVHIADMIVPHHRHLPIGEGNLPLLEILDVLSDSGYSFPAIVEEFNKPYKPSDYWQAAIDFRNNYMNRSN